MLPSEGGTEETHGGPPMSEQSSGPVERLGRSMRRALVVAAIFAFAGCSHWSNDAKSRQDWYGDFHDCSVDASVIADYANGYVRGGVGIEFRIYPEVRPTLFRPFGKRIRENCMMERGWSRESRPNQG
jgi:hypothetical protein